MPLPYGSTTTMSPADRPHTSVRYIGYASAGRAWNVPAAVARAR